MHRSASMCNAAPAQDAGEHISADPCLLLTCWCCLHRIQVLLRNCTLSNSSSAWGGAVAASGNAYVAIQHSSIKLNRASAMGGGLHFIDNSRSNLTQVLLADNSAGTVGGGLAATGSAKVCAVTSHVIHV